MCGITGLVLSNKNRTASDYQEIKTQFSKALVSAQSRGKHAAGLYLINKDGEHYYYRAAVPANVLVEQPAYDAVLSHLGPNTIAIVGHTRFATTGSPSVVENNHPIYDPPLIGVHNGVITNHEQLEHKYGSVAEVDSATILSLLNSRLFGDATLSVADIQDAMPEVRGSWAIAVADIRTNGIFLARNDASPMKLTTQPKQGLLWFGSTVQILSDGLGVNVPDYNLPKNTVVRLTRKSAEKGTIDARRVSNPETYTYHGKVSKTSPSDRYSASEQWQMFPEFFDEGAATARALGK